MKYCKRCGGEIEDSCKTGRICAYCDKSSGAYVRIQCMYKKKLGRGVGVIEAKEILKKEKLKRKI